MAYWLRITLFVLLVACMLTGALSVIDVFLTGEPLAPGDIASDLIEMLVLSAAMVASVIVVNRLGRLEHDTNALRSELSAASDAGRAWRAQSEHLLRGLADAVSSQFQAWGLTHAEADIASLILKGVPLKDIAILRKTSEATIRQQAQSIYRKSGLGNRSELAAYFLEDLFDVANGHAAELENSPTH